MFGGEKSSGAADLVRALTRFGEAGENSAKFLGFEPVVPKITSSENSQSIANEVKQQYQELSELPQQSEDHRLPLPFFVVRQIVAYQLDRPTASLIESKDLPDLSKPEGGSLPYPERIAWSQMLTFFNQQLSAKHPGHSINIPKLQQQLSRLQPVIHLPKKPKTIWRQECEIWRDTSQRLSPVHDDSRYIIGALKAVRGAAGLTERIINHDPLAPKLARPNKQNLASNSTSRPLKSAATSPSQLPRHSQVIIFSDLGVYSNDQGIANKWRLLGQQLSQRGIKPLVLIPAAKSLWPANLLPYFILVYWDASHNFRKPISKNYSTPVIPKIRSSDNLTSAQMLLAKADFTVPNWRLLLALAAPAIRIEYRLLSHLRRLLPNLSITDELLAINSGDVYQTPTGVHFKPEHKYKYEQLFRDLPQATQEQAFELINRCHFPINKNKHLRAEEKAYFEWLQGDSGALTQLLDCYLIESKENSKSRGNHLSYQNWIAKTLQRIPQDATNSKPLKQKIIEVSHSVQAYYIERNINGQVDIPDTIGLGELGLDHQHQETVTLCQQGNELRLARQGEQTEGLVLKQNLATAKGTLRSRINQQPFAQQSLAHIQSLNNFNDGDVLVIDAIDGQYEIRQITIPHWATGLYRTTQGLFAQIKPQYLPPGQSYTELPYPEWADVVEVDGYGIYAEVAIKTPGGEEISQRFRYLPAGQFVMGSPEDEPERNSNETQHPVTLTQGYWLADSACSQALWQAVMGDNPSRFKGEQNPVELVSWEDCQAFIKALNQRYPHWQCRLPTEAEWEYACRAGTVTPFSFGDNITTDKVNYNGKLPYNGVEQGEYRQQTLPVKTAELPANPWGLHQMHGNVWEWCEDWYQDDLGRQPQQDPEGPAEGEYKVLRGGSWNYFAGSCRSAHRLRSPPGHRSLNIGLRLARGALPDQPAALGPEGQESGSRSEQKSSRGTTEPVILNNGLKNN